MRNLAPTFLVASVFLHATGATITAQPKDKPPSWPPISPQNARLQQTIDGLDGPGFAIVASPLGDSILAACENNSIHVWKKDVLLNIRNGSGSANQFRGHSGPVVALAWQGGPVFASAGVDRRLVLWSFAQGKVLHDIRTDFLLRTLAMSPDGKWLLGGGEHYDIYIWDVASGKLVSQLKEHKDWVTAVAYSPDGKWFAAGGYDGALSFWDANNKKKIRNLNTQPKPDKNAPRPMPVQSIAFSPKGDLLAVGSGDSKIYFFNPANGKLTRTVTGHTSAVTDLKFHPNGSLLASASKDRTIRLWNPANGGSFKELKGHEAWVEGLAFATRGTRLASVGADQTVRLWNLTAP